MVLGAPEQAHDALLGGAVLKQAGELAQGSNRAHEEDGRVLLGAAAAAAAVQGQALAEEMHGDAREEDGALEVDVQDQRRRGLLDGGVVAVSRGEQLARLHDGCVGHGVVDAAVQLPGPLEQVQDRGVVSHVGSDKGHVGTGSISREFVRLLDVAKDDFGAEV